MKFVSLLFVALVVNFSASGCVHPPSSLTATGIEAFNKTRIVKSLDVLRDIAIDGNATVPPLVSENTTRKIVAYHRSALLVIDSQGVKGITVTSLDELLKDLPAAESSILTPYVALAKTVLIEVTK